MPSCWKIDSWKQGSRNGRIRVSLSGQSAEYLSDNKVIMIRISESETP